MIYALPGKSSSTGLGFFAILARQAVGDNFGSHMGYSKHCTDLNRTDTDYHHSPRALKLRHKGNLHCRQNHSHPPLSCTRPVHRIEEQDCSGHYSHLAIWLEDGLLILEPLAPRLCCFGYSDSCPPADLAKVSPKSSSEVEVAVYH